MFEDDENNTTSEIRESYHDYMGRRMREENAKMNVKCSIKFCHHYRHPLRQSLMPSNDGSASRQVQ